MADAIWNNNYILSNMDAQKLYAQSPLTTGVSGTSAYIGIEPSAQYNETVLYSGALTSAANLSEPMTAFEKIDVYMASDNTDVNNFHFVNTIDPNNGAKNWPCTNGLGSYAWLAMNLLQTTTAYNTLSCPKYKYINFGSYNSTAASFSVTTGTNANIIRKVVGINRKENA